MADLPESAFTVAVAEIAAVLAQIVGVRLLTPSELAPFGRRFRTGWSVPNLCADSELELRVLVPEFAPFAPARIAVAPAPPVLAWPHLEENGLLCLISDTANASIAAPASVALTLLDEARRLANSSIAGENIEDFEDEFTSYWERWERTKGTMSILCEPRGPSRTLAAWYANDCTYVAETNTALRSWLANRFGEGKVKNLTCSSVPLLWLGRPLRPTEYPATISALRNALHEDPLRCSLLDAGLLQLKPSEKLIVLGMNTRRGVAFAGLQVKKPSKLQHGFRHRPPDNVILTRYDAAATIGARAIRFDPAWVHGRDQNPEAVTLQGKRVVLIGVGSVGCSVADSLVKAGVGTVTCVDPEALVSANSSRHLLGAPDVGVNKAIGVVESLTTRFPHTAIRAIAEAVQEGKHIIGALHPAELIVSLSGNWPAESLLDALWGDDTTLPPILYGWTEPHAGAGHALLLRHGTGCLRCLLDEMGKMRVPVTAWPASTLLQVPACGDLFQPYGAVELAHIQALIAELAIDMLLDRVPNSAHRVWIARRNLVARAGGDWSPGWVTMHGDPGAGGQLCDVGFEGICAKCRCA